MAKSKDLTGQRFGKLVVLKKTDKKEDRYVTWLCRCDCGNETVVNTKRLTRGTITDCGCEKVRRLGPKVADLTGKRYGKLVVIKQVENSLNGRVSWLCKCDCGNETIASAQDLNAGHTRSCGCLKKERHVNLKDLTGKRYGQLVALNATEKRDYKGSVIWNCQCSCGNKILVSEDKLESGHIKSCGCIRKEKAKKLNDSLTFVDGTCLEWLEKRKSRSDNTSGCVGVSQTRTGHYSAYITLSGKRYSLGTYAQFEDAAKARKKGEKVFHDAFLKEYEDWQKKALIDSKWKEENPFHFTITKEELKKLKN